MNTVAGLQQRFGQVAGVSYVADPSGLVLIAIDNPHATASLCLQGAHLMEWRPKSQAEPVVWLSSQAKVAAGKSIRGGVPVCWPWFGAHATETAWPGHGFARTVPWVLTTLAARPDGATELVLELVASDATRAQWPHPSRCELRLVVGATLKIDLVTHNDGPAPFVIGEALHTYFRIGDIGTARVLGLEDCAYLDKVEGMARKRQSGAIRFAGETDRVYVDTPATCVIDDPDLKRRIRIAKAGSRSTVVWTPWADKAAKMGDLGAPAGWRQMVCVESANANDNVVTVAPGTTHTLSVEYAAEAR